MSISSLSFSSYLGISGNRPRCGQSLWTRQRSPRHSSTNSAISGDHLAPHFGSMFIKNGIQELYRDGWNPLGLENGDLSTVKWNLSTRPEMDVISEIAARIAAFSQSLDPQEGIHVLEENSDVTTTKLSELLSKISSPDLQDPHWGSVMMQEAYAIMLSNCSHLLSTVIAIAA